MDGSGDTGGAGGSGPPVSPARVPAPAPTVIAALDDVAALGPWFAVPVRPAAPGPERVRWDALYRDPVPGADPLSDRIDAVAAALRCDRRPAASIAAQALAARLVSFPLATVALHGVLPDLAELHRAPGADDPWAPIPAAAGGVRTPDPCSDPAGAADLLAGALAAAHLEPLHAAVRLRVSVSERVLRGNAVSAIAGAARVLDSARPPARAVVVALLAELVAHPALRGPLPGGATGRLLRRDGRDPASAWSYHRRSCCLYLQVPGGGACGDCVLTAPDRPVR